MTTSRRRARPGLLLAMVAAVTLALVAGACSGSDVVGLAPTTTTGSGAQGPPSALGTVVPLTRAQVDAAVREWVPMAEQMQSESGVPGMATAVVFDDQVVFAQGFGTRQVGTNEPVDANTVFQLASLSKPVGATVMAGLVGKGVIGWDDPIVSHGSTFQLSDPWVTDHVTFADLYAHRSGLPDHAGDWLEDLGYDQAQVLQRLRYVPLKPFRTNYDYTNFGLTEAALTAARADGTTWQDASQQILYGPLKMTSTSSTFADYMSRADRAVPHVRDAQGNWVVSPQQRDPDAQAPAGGASSNVNDMAQWLRLILGQGSVDGAQIIDPKALAQTTLPQSFSSPARTYGARSSFYGLGWNVGTDNQGRMEWSHSGAFALGAGTAVLVEPAEHLAIVTLTNGQPVGLPEAVNRTFMDLALQGRVERDWYPLYHQAMQAQLYPAPIVNPDAPPADAAPPRNLSAYTGTYNSDYYGPAQVVDRNGSLVLILGPKNMEFPLTPYDGDVFTLTSEGENAVGPTTATFAGGGTGKAQRLTVAWLDSFGMGTFTR